MDDKHDGEGSRRWEVISDVDDFISRNDSGLFRETRHKYALNYFMHLAALYDANQLIIQRDANNNIIGVCGFVLIKEYEQEKVNKIRWAFPKNITSGEILYISFCVIKDGNLWIVHRELKEKYKDKIKEVYWFNMPTNKFVRRKNIFKER